MKKNILRFRVRSPLNFPIIPLKDPIGSFKGNDYKHLSIYPCPYACGSAREYLGHPLLVSIGYDDRNAEILEGMGGEGGA